MMQAPAFATAAALPTRASRLAPSLCPRMAVISPVTVPHAPPSQSQIASLFLRLQTREAYTSPNQVSHLATSSSLPAPTASSILRTLFCNAHLMDSELDALTPLLTRYSVTADARELIRAIAKSEAFTSRFVEPMNAWRSAELLYKVLLGRAPASYAEMVGTLSVMQTEGYDAAVDSLLDSEEYGACFGAGLFPQMIADGDYPGGMLAFCAQMRLQLPTRGGNSDVTAHSARTVSTLAGGNAAGVVEIAAGYAVSAPKYESQMDWMKLPASVLLRDWASMTLVGSDVTSMWNGLGTPRKTGEAKEAWADGWTPQATGEQWSPGWFGKTKKYV